MVQELQVLRCCTCSVFQVHIVKKAKKWDCKMCNQKQSLKEVYGKGSGKDCRIHAQKLNALRGMKEGADLTDDLSSALFDSLVSNSEPNNIDEMSYIEVPFQPLTEPKSNKWNKYLETTPDHCEEPEEDNRYLLESSKQLNKKRKRSWNEVKNKSLKRNEEMQSHVINKEVYASNSLKSFNQCGSKGKNVTSIEKFRLVQNFEKDNMSKQKELFYTQQENQTKWDQYLNENMSYSNHNDNQICSEDINDVDDINNLACVNIKDESHYKVSGNEIKETDRSYKGIVGKNLNDRNKTLPKSFQTTSKWSKYLTLENDDAIDDSKKIHYEERSDSTKTSSLFLDENKVFSDNDLVQTKLYKTRDEILINEKVAHITNNNIPTKEDFLLKDGVQVSFSSTKNVRDESFINDKDPKSMNTLTSDTDSFLENNVNRFHSELKSNNIIDNTKNVLNLLLSLEHENSVLSQVERVSIVSDVCTEHKETRVLNKMNKVSNIFECDDTELDELLKEF